MYSRGAVTISSLNKQFIQECRAKGHVSINQALEIAEGLGLFDDDYAGKAIERDKKQKIRSLMSAVTYGGDRAIRSVRLEDGPVYVDLLNIENLAELNLLIMAENQRITRNKKIVQSLKRVRNKVQLQGQISLQDLYSDAL